MILRNLSPHPMRVYAPEVPNRITPGEYAPYMIIPPAEQAVRATEVVVSDPWQVQGVPVVDVRAGQGTLPPPEPGVRYIVARPVALAALAYSPDRTDLLVVNATVRDHEGHTLGCRGFARIVGTVR